MSSKPKSLLPPEVEQDLQNLTASGRCYFVGWVVRVGEADPAVAACLQDFHQACSESETPMIDAFAIERQANQQAA